MILTKLKEYADTQMNLPPEMYGETKIRWLIELKTDGTLDGFTPLGGDGKANRAGEPFMVPQILRASGIKPKLLADNGEYVLGIARSESKPKQVAERHRQFVGLIQKCAEVTQKPSVKAIARFLTSNWDRSKLPPDLDPKDIITFRVDGVIPADARAELQSIQNFWAIYTSGNGDEEASTEPTEMACLVTGKTGPVEERLPVKIKGIPGGQTAGTSLVSANAPPFTSYGLKNSLTSPISRDAGERFAKALNYLIATESSRLYLGSVLYVFWTRKKFEYNFWTHLQQPQPEEVKRLYQSACTGQQVHNLAENQFYALALSASGGRAVVRDWIETSIPEALNHLSDWFQKQSIVNTYGEPGRPLGVFTLAASAYRDAKKEMTATVPTTLVKVALRGGRLPDDLLARTISRNRVEQDITYERAALIKLILATQGFSMADMQTLNLNPELELAEDRSAYHCGRLLAQLEQIQRAAQGKGINTTLVDRYYGAASSAPARVLGSLIHGAQAHLSKLRKDQRKRSAYEALQKNLEEIISHLPPENLPKTLTLQQQSLFALGYYHQRANNRKAALDAKSNQNQQENN